MPATPSRQHAPVRWWRRPEILAAATALVCYLNVLPNDYCYDDDPIVRYSAKVNKPLQWGAVWTTDHWSETRSANPHRDLLYRPVTLSSYRLIRLAAGAAPLAQHIANLALHALVCVLAVRLCRTLGGGDTAATAAGLLFASLPIHSEVVASVVGRADLLSTSGILLTLLCHRRSTSAHHRRSALLWRLAAAFAAFAAVGSKESGAAVFVLLVLFDLYWFGPWPVSIAVCHGQTRLPVPRTTRPPQSRRGLRRAPLRLCHFLLPLAAYVLLRRYALGGVLYQEPPLTRTVNVLVDAPAWQHALGVVQLWGMYWAKTFWPAVLSIKYSINGIRLATSPLDPHVLLGGAVTVGLIALSVVAWRRGQRGVALAAGALVLSYLPTANALILMQVFFAERIWYLPSVWVVVLIGLLLSRRIPRPLPWSVVGLVVLVMGLRGWVRCGEWRNNGTLYAAAYRDQPDAAGPLQLYGQWLVSQGDYARGGELLNRAVQIDLGFTDAHRSLGEAHYRTGNLHAALWHLQTADMQAPGHQPTTAMIQKIRGELLASDTELPALRRRAEEHPDDVDAEVALIRKLRDVGLIREALERFEARESVFNDRPAWQAEYAVTLVYLNRRDEAIDRYRKCIQLGRTDPAPIVELAMLLLERRDTGDLDEAQRLADHADKLAPARPEVIVCRAELLAARGRAAQAAALYKSAIDALPPGSAQRAIFEQRRQALGGAP